MDDKIATAAEAFEAAHAPRIHEVHTDPARCAPDGSIIAGKAEPKSEARWAYERLVLYIQNFEKQLDDEHEVAMGFAGDSTGVIKIEGMGYYDPDIITFYGSDPSGAKTQLIQHVSQLSVKLRATQKPTEAVDPERIGFRLAAELDGAPATSEPTAKG
ncbi:MAG: DUF6173 family protein [Octadecabacter sp.]